MTSPDTVSVSDATRAVIRRLEHAVNTRRPDLLADIVTDDFVRHCEATPGVDVRTRGQFADFLGQDLTVFPDSVQTFEHILVDGDMAAVWATYEGTQDGPMGPFPASGKKARFWYSGIMRMERGRIAEWWVTWDNMTILAQLGHLGAEAPGG
jgi:predicted ester cyclase